MSMPFRPHVVVLGNHKGGSGKSTLAMHVAIGLLKEGFRVASLDLDIPQRTLTRYIENRRRWGNEKGRTLVAPRHFCLDELSSDITARSDTAKAALISATLGALEPFYDFIVIDTAGGGGHLNVFAHGLADTLVTPVNDSFLDLDVIIQRDGSSNSTPVPSVYADAVRKALEARHLVTKRKTDWLVVRNRMFPLFSRNERDVHGALESMSRHLGFRLATGLMERVVYREFFPLGLTAFDSLETSLIQVKPTISHLQARLEVRQLIAAMRLLSEPLTENIATSPEAEVDPLDPTPTDSKTFGLAG